MLSTWREQSLLGSYQEREYSKGFQKMMNKVVAKIYRNKKTQQSVLKTLVPVLNGNFTPRRQSRKIGSFSQQKWKRKDYPVGNFYSIYPKSSIVKLRRSQISSKYSLPSFKTTQDGKKITSKSNKRLHSLQPTQSSAILFKKISHYNTCLITKTFKFQEKDNIATCLDEEQQKDSPDRQKFIFVSRIKRCEDLRRNNKWIHSKGKFINQKRLFSQVKEDFKPWQIDHCDELQY